MRYSYVLFGLIIGYLFFDFSPNNQNVITKKKFFEIVKWDNVTINSVIINKDKDLANIKFDLMDYTWYSLDNNNMCYHNITDPDIEEYCYPKKHVKYHNLEFNLQLPINHNFEKDLSKNDFTKDLEILFNWNF